MIDIVSKWPIITYLADNLSKKRIKCVIHWEWYRNLNDFIYFSFAVERIDVCKIATWMSMRWFRHNLTERCILLDYNDILKMKWNIVLNIASQLLSCNANHYSYPHFSFSLVGNLTEHCATAIILYGPCSFFFILIFFLFIQLFYATKYLIDRMLIC